MAKIIEFPVQTRVEAGADNADHPFIGTHLYERLFASANKRAPVAAELIGLMQRPAGRRCPNVLQALSLEPIRNAKRRGFTGAEVFSRLKRREPGIDNLLGSFGMLMLRWPMEGEPMELALNLDHGTAAEAIYQKCNMPMWRTCIAERLP